MNNMEFVARWRQWNADRYQSEGSPEEFQEYLDGKHAIRQVNSVRDILATEGADDQLHLIAEIVEETA